MKKIFVLLMSFLLSACGFHLRGQTELAPALRKLQLQTNAPYSPLTKELQRTLTERGIQLITPPETAPLTLSILNDAFSQQTTNLSPASQVTTFTLNYVITYQLKNATGRVLRGPLRATATRIYNVNSNQILGSTNEQPLLQQDLRRDAIAQLLYQLSARETVEALQYATQQ
jgi:LPS-assembly lipoprotein